MIWCEAGKGQLKLHGLNGKTVRSADKDGRDELIRNANPGRICFGLLREKLFAVL